MTIEEMRDAAEERFQKAGIKADVYIVGHAHVNDSSVAGALCLEAAIPFGSGAGEIILRFREKPEDAEEQIRAGLVNCATTVKATFDAIVLTCNE